MNRRTTFSKTPNVATVLFANLFTLFMYTGCSIEPPLNLPSQFALETKMNYISDLQIDTLTWYYGWDENDSIKWGTLAYPRLGSFEVRKYYNGNDQHAQHTNVGTLFVNKNPFRDRVGVGWYDMLVLSEFGYLPFGQSVVIDEHDLDSVTATTTTRTSRFLNEDNDAKESLYTYFNNPDVFYRSYKEGIYISRDTADYDYYDPMEDVWVKKQEMLMLPAVYFYLVQVILYNNNGRVDGCFESCAINGLARSVNLTTGWTSMDDVSVLFEMRQKNDIQKDSAMVDVIGGKLTTFGLCGLEPYKPGDSFIYKGERADVNNYYMLNAHFSNGTDSSYVYNVTDQFHSQCYGGIITVEIDVDTLEIPVNPTPSKTASGFDPYVEQYENEEYEIVM